MEWSASIDKTVIEERIRHSMYMYINVHNMNDLYPRVAYSLVENIAPGETEQVRNWASGWNSFFCEHSVFVVPILFINVDTKLTILRRRREKSLTQIWNAIQANNYCSVQPVLLDGLGPIQQPHAKGWAWNCFGQTSVFSEADAFVNRVFPHSGKKMSLADFTRV